MVVTKKLISDCLSPFYTKQEIDGISRLIFEKVCGLSRLQFHLNQSETISAANLAQIREIINRLIQFEPIQYILGETEFYGLVIKVNPSVLIPRPETEELVDWIISDYQKMTPSILDIGTGSGCIPIGLVKNLPESAAEGWDISLDALTTAGENARNNHVKIDFQCVDILKYNDHALPPKYDIIVSNPPYITVNQAAFMHENVIHHEPHIALFVPDTDPLIFYRAIANLAINRLKPGGHLYFEINESLGYETVELLKSKGFINITLKNDINGKERMIRGER